MQRAKTELTATPSNLGGVGSNSIIGRSPSHKPRPAPDIAPNAPGILVGDEQVGAVRPAATPRALPTPRSPAPNAVPPLSPLLRSATATPGHPAKVPSTTAPDFSATNGARFLDGTVPAAGPATSKGDAATIRFRPQQRGVDQPQGTAGGSATSTSAAAKKSALSTLQLGHFAEEPNHSTKEQQLDYENRTVVIFGVPAELHEELAKKLISECGASLATHRLGRSALQVTFSSHDGCRKALERDDTTFFAGTRANVVRLAQWKAAAAPTVALTAPLLLGAKAPPSASTSATITLPTTESDFCVVSYPLLMRLPFADKLLLPFLRRRTRREDLPEGALKRKR